MYIDYGTMFSIEKLSQVPPMKDPDYSLEDADSNEVPEDQQTPPDQQEEQQSEEEQAPKPSMNSTNDVEGNEKSEEECGCSDKSKEAYEEYYRRHPEMIPFENMSREQLQEAEQHSLEDLEKIAKDVKNTTKETADKLKKGFKNAAKDVKNNAKKVGKKVKDAFDKGTPTSDEDKKRIKEKHKKQAMEEYYRRHPEAKRV